MRNSSKLLNEGSTKQYLQDWSIVKDIKYGMVVTKDNRYLTILKVSPINYHMRSSKEQEEVINQFANWLKFIPAKIQFIISTNHRNSDALIKNIRKNTKNEKDSDIKELQDDYIENSIKRLSADETVSKNFYVVMQYECNIDGEVSKDEMEIAKTLMELRLTTHDIFRRFGCFVEEHEDENFFQAKCIYEALNPKSAKQEDLSDRMDRIFHDHYEVQKKIKPEIDINDYLVPRNIDDSYPRFVFIDGVYQETVYIKGKTIPGIVYGGWLDSLSSCGKGFVTSVTVVKENKQAVIEQTSRSMRLTRSSLRNNGDVERVDELQQDISNNSYIHKVLKNTEEDIFNVCITIKMTADTFEELVLMKKSLVTLLKRYDIQVGDCYIRELEALKMTLPLLYISKPIFDKCKRNFLTSSLASMFPFTSFELFSEKGVVFGVNVENNSLTVPDIFDTSRFLNANVAIFGQSGSGKTFTEQMLGYAYRLSGYKVFYILPTKGHEYRRGCKAIKGSYIKLSPGCDICLNPLGILPENDADERLIEGEGYTKASYLAKKIAEFKAFTQLLLRNEPLSIVEETKLDIILTKLYRKFGITEDNNSIYADETHTVLKQMPIISDLYEMLKEEPLMEKVAICFEIFIHGSWQNLNAQTNIDLSNNYIVFDVDDTEIHKNLHPAFLLLATLTAYSYIKQSRTEKCVLFLDEVWKSMIKEESAELVFEIVKIIRGYGGAVVLGTQEINDYFGFMDGKYGKGIINNTKIKILLHMEDEALDSIVDILKLNSQERKLIYDFKKGYALMVANNDHITVRFKATAKQEELFTTDVNKLQEIARRNKDAEEGVMRWH